MGSRIWSVVVVDVDGKVSMENHVTDVHDSSAAYKEVDGRIKGSKTIVAMIPGNHITASKTYDLGRTKNTSAWIDPFDMPDPIA